MSHYLWGQEIVAGDLLNSENLQPMHRKTQKIGIFVEQKTKMGFRIYNFT